MPTTEALCASDPDRWLSPSKIHVDYARKMCTVCKLQPVCLEQALDFQKVAGEPLRGVVAGFLPEERMRMRRTA